MMMVCMALGGNEESGLSLPESQLSQEKPARLLPTQKKTSHFEKPREETRRYVCSK